MVVVNMSKSKKVRKLNDKLKKEFTVVEPIPFDCTKCGDHYNIFYHPRKNPRAWLSCHISDNAMRNILNIVLEQENMQDISNEDLCKWMISRGIVDEVSASVYVLNYIANKGSE